MKAKLLFLPDHRMVVVDEDIKLSEKLWFVWFGSQGPEVHQFHSDAGYGIKTYTGFNETDGSSELVNWSNASRPLVATSFHTDLPILSNTYEEVIDMIEEAKGKRAAKEIYNTVNEGGKLAVIAFKNGYKSNPAKFTEEQMREAMSQPRFNSAADVTHYINSLLTPSPCYVEMSEDRRTILKVII